MRESRWKSLLCHVLAAICTHSAELYVVSARLFNLDKINTNRGSKSVLRHVMWTNLLWSSNDLAILDEPFHDSAIRLAFELGGKGLLDERFLAITVALCDGGFVEVGKQGGGTVDVVIGSLEQASDGDGVV